jgi:putative phosphotransacetylase
MASAAVDVEELRRLIVQRVMERLAQREQPAASTNAGIPSIPIGVSVRHAHLCKEDLEVLYVPGHELTPLRELYQTGEYAAREVVTVVGPRLRSLADVRVLGPLRKRTQVELAQTDCIVLGIQAPVRPSGQLDGAASITLVGPRGSLTLREAAIRANRHIPLSPAEADAFGVHDNELVTVRVPGPRALVFENVQIRIGAKLKLQMHVDTDDANAADIQCDTPVTIVGKQGYVAGLQTAQVVSAAVESPAAVAAVEPAPAEGAASPDGNGALRLTSSNGSRVIVTQAEIQEASRDSKHIIVPAGSIITSLAAELASARGVTIEEEG